MLSSLFQVKNVKLIVKHFRLSVEKWCEERGRLVVLPGKWDSRVNQEKDELFRQITKKWVIRVRNAQSLYHWHVFTLVHKKKPPFFLHDHNMSSCNVWYVVHYSVAGQKYLNHLGVHDIYYAYIIEEKTISLLWLMYETDQTLRSACDFCFPTHICSRNARHFAHFIALAGQIS